MEAGLRVELERGGSFCHHTVYPESRGHLGLVSHLFFSGDGVDGEGFRARGPVEEHAWGDAASF